MRSGNILGKIPATIRTVIVTAAVVAVSPAASAQQEPAHIAITPENPVTLTTTTPLGEARITLPAGVPLENYRIEGDWVVVSSGPFNARVPLAELVPPTPVPTPTPPEETVVEPEPTPEPTPTPVLEANLQALLNGETTALIIASSCAFLVLYALLMTVLWLNLRRTAGRRNRTASS